MILVTGATGSVGRHVVLGLLAVGHGVRALTRNPDGAGIPERAGGNILHWAPQIQAGDVVRAPYPLACTAPIHERDIAAVAVR